MIYHFIRQYFDTSKSQGFALAGVSIPNCPQLYNYCYNTDPLIDSIKNIIKDSKQKITNICIHIIAQKPRFCQDNINYKRKIEDSLRVTFNIQTIVVHAGTGESVGKTGRAQAIDIHICVGTECIIGYGFDRHQLISPIPDKDFILSGLVWDLPHYSIKSHSDGDLALHSIVDALFAAISLPDIGEYFPDTSKENKARPSIEFLNFALTEIKARNLKIKSLHLKLFTCEYISDSLSSQDFVCKSRENIAKLCNIDQHIVQVNIDRPIIFYKESKTSCVTRCEAIESQAIIQLNH